MEHYEESGKSGLKEAWAGSIRAAQTPDSPGWLKALRQGAAAQFMSNGLPGNKDEAWKYTSLRRLEALGPRLDGDMPGAESSDWQPLLPREGDFGFRFVEGKLQWLQAEVPAGVRMHALGELFSRDNRELQARLQPLLEGVEITGRSHAFEALNTAMLNNGAVIHVGAGVDAGVCQAQWGTRSGTSSRLDNFRLVIILEAGAKLSLLEQFQDAGPERRQLHSTGQVLNVVMQAHLGEEAELQHLRVQKEAPEDILFTFGHVQQAKGSSYVYTGFDIGGGLVRHDLNCRLMGQGARAEVSGAFVLDQERHVDHHICIDHRVPSCCSEQFFRGVLGGCSRGVFNGRAVIRAGADGSRVRQSNANLLLSDQAEMDTKPELEIYADEVEASHGATVGSLDEQAVFYLRSRGIEATAARRMLTSAFCRCVSDRLPDAQLAEQVAVLLEAALPNVESGAEEKQ